MTHALLLALLLAAKPHPRPKHSPPPPPPAAAQAADAEEDVDHGDPEADEPADFADPDEASAAGEADEAPRTGDFGAATGPRRHRRGDAPELTDEQYQAIGAASLCCCFVFFVGLVALIVWLVRRATSSSKPAAQAPPVRPQPAAPPQARLHLSVLAVGMHATARQLVSQQLLVAGVQADPTTAPERAQLVRELSKAVRGLETEWTHFGYGERLDLADEAAAQGSYQRAVEDFTKRSLDPGLSGESAYVVMTLVLCTRRQLRGVSALDDRSQIRALLDERAGLGEAELMGAYITWSAPLGGHEVLTRFPEMHAVR